MSIPSRILGWAFKLPPAETHDVVIERDIQTPMPDGVVLLADHYYPRDGAQRPTILIRSPYGRRGFWGLLLARSFAERGFQVLIQSCRGTFGSGGQFNAFRNERVDGLTTLAWLKQQPWFSGEVATVGPSYLGFVQWAIAAEAGPELRAMAVQITASEFRSLTYPGESLALDSNLTWIDLMHHQDDNLRTRLTSQRKSRRALDAALNHLPLREADKVAVGETAPYFQDWLEHNQPDDPWWKPVDFSENVSNLTVPIHLFGGWYDIFLPQTLGDYTRLRQAGRQPFLTVGPWTHANLGGIATMLRESIRWLRAQLLGDGNPREFPVRIYVMGANEWRDYPDWPPTGTSAQRWHLQPSGGLSTDVPAMSEPDHYRYDPANPTPAVGGVSLSQNAGPKDNRTLEARPDVLTYTSKPLERDLEIIGAVSAELYTQSSLEFTDFFARLCDVDGSGKSINVCDGLLRLRPGHPAVEADDLRRVCIDLWPTAYRFRRGHRIRLQVSSGSHPRFARNPGSGEPLATATRLITAEQSIYHDPTHPSAVILPTLL